MVRSSSKTMSKSNVQESHHYVVQVKQADRLDQKVMRVSEQLTAAHDGRAAYSRPPSPETPSGGEHRPNATQNESSERDNSQERSRQRSI
jgi:hypothetical protein